MDERELEQRLRTAVEHAAPDPLDRILAACGPQAGTVLPFEAPKKKRRWAPLAVAAALVVMCCGAFGISSWRGANAVDSVVMLDVNPSLSMTVSSKERVLSVTPFNQDAEVILGDMDLTGTDLDVAVNALIGSMLQNGYLSDIQNAILVSVENQDAAKSAQLQQHLTDTINSVFQGGSLEGAVLSQTVTESADLNALAQQYGITEELLVPQQESTFTTGEDSDVSYIQQKGTLVVGITEFAPMDYKDENGQWIGFDADLAKLVAERLGVEIQFVVIDWGQKINELDSKAIDVVWNGMTLTDGVMSAMACTNAYCKNAQVVVVRGQ